MKDLLEVCLVHWQMTLDAADQVENVLPQKGAFQ